MYVYNLKIKIFENKKIVKLKFTGAVLVNLQTDFIYDSSEDSKIFKKIWPPLKS